MMTFHSEAEKVRASIKTPSKTDKRRTPPDPPRVEGRRIARPPLRYGLGDAASHVLRQTHNERIREATR